MGNVTPQGCYTWSAVRRSVSRPTTQATNRSGLVLFIVAAAQIVAFVLMLQQVPHALAGFDDYDCPR